MTQELTWRFKSKMRGRELAGQVVPPGPWDDEPDKVQWIDEVTGYDCLIVRGPAGALCGYVGLPPEHRLYGIGYSEIEPWTADGPGESLVDDIRVHGGLTFSEFCAPDEPIEGICHIAERGATEQPWWFGFDCAHGGDDYPMEHYVDALLAVDAGNHSWRRREHRNYRNVDYVKGEVRDLARQFKAAE